MIVGKSYDFRTAHPLDLVNDLYADVFDNHPPESEIDLAIMTTFEDGVGTITDMRIFRVSDGSGGTRYQGFSGDTPLDMMREMVEWTRGHGPDAQFMWMHKHPEGMPEMSIKDADWNNALTAIDFGTSNGATKRTYLGGAVINRTKSTPVHPPRMALPIGIADIDARVVSESFRRLADKQGLPADDPARETMRQLAEAIETDDEDRIFELVPILVAKIVEISGPRADQLRKDILPPGVNLKIDELLAKSPPQQPTPPPAFLMDLPKELRDLLGLPASDNIVKPDKEQLN